MLLHPATIPTTMPITPVQNIIADPTKPGWLSANAEYNFIPKNAPAKADNRMIIILLSVCMCSKLNIIYLFLPSRVD